MRLKRLPYDLSVCKLASAADADPSMDFFFFAKTGTEVSLVCPAASVPEHTVAREDGWRGFCLEGPLEFSLVGILARASGVLAEGGISIFALSTYDTDYILVKKESFDRAAELLIRAGYEVENEISYGR